MNSLIYVIFQVAYSLGSTLSRLINLVFFRGSFHQTLSARAYYEAVVDPSFNGWDRRMAFINRVFFWQKDHCRDAWLSEVERARKTLILNGQIKS